MGDIDDFFAKKDKKKKGTKKFSKANTDVIAKNLLDSDRYEYNIRFISNLLTFMRVKL